MRAVPKKYRQFMESYPEVGRAYEALGQATSAAGPLTQREVGLIKLAISLGARLEGGAKSHARKALEAGATAGELRHVAILSAPTIGFPAMMAGLSAVNEVLEVEDEN